MTVKVYLLESNTEFDTKYTYVVPDELNHEMDVGVFVSVPFGGGNKLKNAMVAEVCQDDERYFINKAGRKVALKEIKEVQKKYIKAAPETMDLCKKMIKRYGCTFGDALSCMLNHAPSDKFKTEKAYCLNIGVDEAKELLDTNKIRNISQIKALEVLISRHGELIKKSEAKGDYLLSESSLETLTRHGFVKTENITYKIENNPEEEQYEIYPAPQLNDEQINARNKIKELTENPLGGLLLLKGVTGSGKTEVYLSAIKDVIDNGGGCILLVPEISLTPQTVKRLKGRFGGNVAVLHSRLTPDEKLREMKKIRDGLVNVVVGARSAVFAPIHNLKLIILDEEQEPSYKSNELPPRYSAGEIAEMRREISGCTVVYGSATPSVNTYYRALSGEIGLSLLSKRASKGELPVVKVIDMAKEKAENGDSIFAKETVNAMISNYKAGNQTVIFVPRRGFSGRMICKDCGRMMICGKCRIPMTYHKKAGRLICHYCGNTTLAPRVCPKCGGTSFLEKTIGTESVEQEIKRLFGDVQTIRMDSDTTDIKDGHRILLEKFEKENVPFLIGTQMIAKGLDFPKVTLAVMINGDSLLTAQDYKAGERAFQLLTQFFGRAGRSDSPGYGILQVMDCDEPVFGYSIRQNYDDFAKNELGFRRQLDYPPFTSLMTVNISGVEDRETYDAGVEIRKRIDFMLKNKTKENGTACESYELLGIVRARVPVIDNRYYWTFMVKSKNKEMFCDVMNEFLYNDLKLIHTKASANIRVTVDVE